MSCRRAREIDAPAYLLDPRAAEWQDFRAHFPTCEVCWEEVAKWSKLEELVFAAVEPEEPIHPAEAVLLRYVDTTERLESDARSMVDLHLRACAKCREDLAALRAFELATATPAGHAATQMRAKTTGSFISSFIERLHELVAAPMAIPALAAIAVALLLVALVANFLPGSTSDLPSPGPAGRDLLIAAELPPAPIVTVGKLMESQEAPPEHMVAELLPSPGKLIEKPPEPRADPIVAEQAIDRPGTAVPTVPVEPSPRTPVLSEPILIASLDLSALPSSAPFYAPSFGLGSARIDALVRTAEIPGSAIFALVPAEIGVTTREQPVLYWFIGDRTDARIDFTLINSESYETLLEFTTNSPAEAGFHAVRLADTGIRLKPDVTYQWSVAVIPDARDRSKDLFSAGGLRRVEMTDALAEELDSAPVAEHAHILAREGIWYDALGSFSDWITSNPDDTRLREHRAALLGQAGLVEPARFDRAAASPPSREP